MAASWHLIPRSTVARFVLLAFAFQIAIIGGSLLFVRQASEGALAEEQRQSVDDLRDELLDAYRDGGQLGLTRLISNRLQSPRHSIAVILLATPDGTPLIGNLGDWPTTVPSRTDWREIELYRTGSDRPERMGISTTQLPDGTRLLMGHVSEANIRLARINEEVIGAALIGGLCLILMSALLLGRVLSRQIKRITSTTTAFVDGALAERVPIRGSGDAFDDLGRAINVMLDRIEKLISELRVLTDGLAHDLKSPVTRLKSVLERAVLETRDPDALAALDRVACEADTLLSMLTTALLISRAEGGIGRDHFVATDIGALLDDLAEIYGPVAEDRGFAIETSVETTARVFIHRELISRAVGNLIDNALNYAVGGTRILIHASAFPGGLTIAVSDDGPGIPPERHADALRRFGRLDPARNIGGSGLGLALVEATAGLHHGDLALEDNAPGVRVVLRLNVSLAEGD